MSKTLNDLGIVDSITVFNRTYLINLLGKVKTIQPTEENPLNEEECNGMIQYDEQMIFIDPTIHPEAQLLTLFHEMAHIAFHPFIVKDKIPIETACDAVANLMYDFCHNFYVEYCKTGKKVGK